MIDSTREAFDLAAPVYDEAYEGLPGIRYMRTATRRLFLRFFPPESTVLEINCGTGNDAVYLAERGIHVLATDLSPRMLGEADKKIAERRFPGSVTTRCLSFSELGELQGMKFDGAYSNMGGLNCTDALEETAAALGALMKDGGILIATVMPKFCLWESAAFLGRGRWGEAFRRMKPGGAAARLHGGVVQTYYHSPGAFRKAFERYFDHVTTVGLAVLLPPPNFAGSYERLGGMAGTLARLDERAGRLPLLRSMGDHYSIVMRRKREP